MSQHRKSSRVICAAACVVLNRLATGATPSYNFTPVGLIGSPYSYANATGNTISTQIYTLNSSGQIVGVSNRYNASSSSLGQDTWYFDGSTTTQVGLTGGAYSYTYTGTGGGTFQSSSPSSGFYPLNSAGQFDGRSFRYGSSGTALGQDAWIYSSGTLTTIGLTGPNYSYSISGAGGGTAEQDFPYGINNSGQVLGLSQRYNSTGASLGQDIWFYNGTTTQQIGLTGSAYTYAYSGGGTFEYSVANTGIQGPDDAGYMWGFSRRYNTAGTQVGQDAWLFNGSTTQQIGFTGTNYSYNFSSGGVYQSSSVSGMNYITSEVYGTSNRYSSTGASLGQDAWVVNNGVLQQVGFTGSGYQYKNGAGVFESSTVSGINQAGQVYGVSSRYTSAGGSNGQDAWIVTNGAIHQIGLTGTGYTTTSGSESSSATAMTESGKATGFSSRYDSFGISLGSDPWVYDGTTTKQIGLTGGSDSYPYDGSVYRTGSPKFINNAGRVAGITERFNSQNLLIGQDSWVYNGSSTVPTGLTGGAFGYTYTGSGGGTYQMSTPLGLNANGQAYGTSNRYTSTGSSLGTSGWFFDPQSGQSSSLAFSFRSSDNFSSTSPTVLTDTGYVLGNYELYNGTTDMGARGFLWSESGGFFDLGTVVNGGLASQQWQYLKSPNVLGYAPDGSPLFVIASGLASGQSSGSSACLLSASSTLPIGQLHTVTASSDAQIGTPAYGLALFGGTLSITASFNSNRPIAVNVLTSTINVTSGSTFGIGSSGPFGWFGGTLTIAGGGNLVIAQASPAVAVLPGSTLSIAAGSTATINGPVDPLSDATLAANHVAIANSGSFVVNTNVTVAAISGAGSTIVGTGAALIAPSIHQQSLMVNGTVLLQSSGQPGVVDLASLNIAGHSNGWIGKLDLAGTSMVLHNADAATIANQLLSGFDQGAWDGAGIVSSTAHNDSAFRTALGYALAGDLGINSFAGENVAAADLLVEYTSYGDSNLDGKVDVSDFQRYLDGLAAHGTTWSQGDFTYDGKVDLGNDFTLFLENYLHQGGVLGNLAAPIEDSSLSSAQKAQLLAVVPEPASAGILFTGAVSFLARRKRK